MILGARWAIILAAGEGSRLRLLTTDDRGIVTPKQFCSLRGGASLLEQTLARAERCVPRDRVVVVVARDHEPFWRAQLAHLPAANVIPQPSNRGTAVGLLLPLLHIMARDPEPSLLVLPADHHVRDEATLHGCTDRALTMAARGDAGVVLLGMSPECATSDYGWIVPGARRGAVHEVQAFVEKPNPSEAARLMARGGIWNSFLFTARGRALLDLIEARAPGIAHVIDDALRLGGDTLDRIYQPLRSVDLSRDIFAHSAPALRVMQVPACGWTDLGTPQRVVECLEHGVLDRAEVPHRGVSVSLMGCVRRAAASA
jgi:mannose-1-phosphate guanylyltransferase